jgi:hypothetical protein
MPPQAPANEVTQPMKKILFLFSMLCVCHVATAQTQAWVRQTVLEAGLIYDIPLDATQTSNPFTAFIEVGDEGSLFQLYATGTAWDTNIYMLDSKLVYTYSPGVAFNVTTEDSTYVRGDTASKNGVYRTRADRPFSMKITVTGLKEDGEEQAERYVYFSTSGVNYDLTSYSGLNQPSYLIQESNLDNGVRNIGPVYHELSSTSASLGCGAQTYKIVRYASDGVPATILAAPTVEVWPVATATVDNLVEGQLYIDRLPTLIVNLNHLYPDSRTYVQIYSGPAVLGKVGTIVTGTELRYGRFYNPDLTQEPTNVAQTRKLSITDLSNYAYLDGTYTLEVITETPFFGRTAERLAHITFDVDRIITSRGKISSNEKP